MSEFEPAILFVDDEVSVLDGLRRKLADQDWSMRFAAGGAAALAMMAEQPADVVISDMRMPGMDGATLLDEVRRHYPSTARFILSGFSEREAIFRTLGPAHQYFAKPCDTGSLVRAVERTLQFRRRLNSRELLTIIAGPKAIPSLPSALTALLDQLQSPNGSLTEVARIISSDIGLTAQILKLVNSAYFMLPSNVGDIHQAVKLLGFELIRSVAVLAGIFEALKSVGIDLDGVTRLQTRSLLIGSAARRIAEMEGLDGSLALQIHSAGMLCHVGTLLLLANRPQQMADLQRGLDQAGGEIIAAETSRFGTSHPELGACLLSHWGFNDDIVEAVLYHHQPSAAPAGTGLGMTAVMHAVQHLVKTQPADKAEQEAWLNQMDLDFFAKNGSSGRIAAWLEAIGDVKKGHRP